MSKALRVSYVICYSLLGVYFFVLAFTPLDLSKLPEIFLISLFFFTAYELSAVIPRTKNLFALIQPFYVLSVLVLKSAAPLSFIIGKLAYFIKHKRPIGNLRQFFEACWSLFSILPGIGLASWVYQRLGGTEFHALREIHLLPLAAMIVVLWVGELLSLLDFNVISSVTTREIFFDVWLSGSFDSLFFPVAIVIYLFYQSIGPKGLLFSFFPVWGILLMVKVFFQGVTKNKESLDLLNVANELISTTLNFKGMAERIAQRVGGIFRASTVELFINEGEGFKLEASVGENPWSYCQDKKLFFDTIKKALPNAPSIYMDTSKEPPFDFYKKHGLSSLLLIPLVSGKQNVGFILCGFSSAPVFHAEFIEFSRILVGQLSSALSGAKLHEELVVTLQELRETQSQLVQSEKMAGLGKLVAGVAHELNNPLNFISMQIPLLEQKVKKLKELVEIYEGYEPALPKEDRDLLGELKQTMEVRELTDYFAKSFAAISEGTNRSRHIVDNLRTFARTEALGENKDFVDLHEALDSTLTLLAPLHEGRVNLHKEYGDIPKVWCDGAQMNQVFMNILANAFDAIEGHGEVWLKTFKSGDNVEIVIVDSGHGIPDEIVERIFEPFFTTKEVGKGTGLGLSIAYGIVKRHQGEIRIESAPGKGTTITITLPVGQPEEAASRT